jgi:Hexapeptide repeat of succinyl-transferase
MCELGSVAHLDPTLASTASLIHLVCLILPSAVPFHLLHPLDGTSQHSPYFLAYARHSLLSNFAQLHISILHLMCRSPAARLSSRSRVSKFLQSLHSPALSDPIFHPVFFPSENVWLILLSDPVLRQDPTYSSSSAGADIIVGDDCWIGGHVTILAGVEIGKACVIGANSVVTKSIPPYSVAYGSPARVRKKIPVGPEARLGRERESDEGQIGGQWLVGVGPELMVERIDDLDAPWIRNRQLFSCSGLGPVELLLSVVAVLLSAILILLGMLLVEME